MAKGVRQDRRDASVKHSFACRARLLHSFCRARCCVRSLYSITASVSRETLVRARHAKSPARKSGRKSPTKKRREAPGRRENGHETHRTPNVGQARSAKHDRSARAVRGRRDNAEPANTEGGKSEARNRMPRMRKRPGDEPSGASRTRNVAHGLVRAERRLRSQADGAGHEVLALVDVAADGAQVVLVVGGASMVVYASMYKLRMVTLRPAWRG